MEFHGNLADFTEQGWEELQRGVAALARNSSRPHKRLVQRGSFVYSTGNVLHRSAASVRFSSVLEEAEHAISLRAQEAVPSWQDNEPALQRDQYEITAKIFVKPTSATLPLDVKQIIASVLSAQQTTYIDTLVIAAPEVGDFDALFDAWAVAESLYASGVVRRLGVSNVDADRLQTLFASAHVRPEVVQATISSAALISSLATANCASVFVDSDSDSSLSNSSKRFGFVFHNALVPPFAETSFSPLALARYTVFVPERAILVGKGYTVKSKYTIA